MCDEASSSLKSSQVWHPSFADGFTNHCTNEAFAALSLQSYRHRWINQTMRSLYTPNKQKKIYIYTYIYIDTLFFSSFLVQWSCINLGASCSSSRKSRYHLLRNIRVKALRDTEFPLTRDAKLQVSSE